MKTFDTKDLATIPSPEGSQNRGMENRVVPEDNKPTVIGLEFINEIVREFIELKIEPKVDVATVSTKVPVIYGDSERWETVRKWQKTRDLTEGKLFPPMIVLRRNSVNRNSVMTNPVNKYLQTAVVSRWNNRNSYDRFAVQNGINPSQKFMNIMIPDYVDLEYDVLMWTNLQTQMDQLIEQINVESDEYWGERNNYKFRVRIESYNNMSELPAEEDRTIRVEFSMKVSGYLIPNKILRNLKPSSTSELNYSPKTVEFNEIFTDAIPGSSKNEG